MWCLYTEQHTQKCHRFGTTCYVEGAIQKAMSLAVLEGTADSNINANDSFSPFRYGTIIDYKILPNNEMILSYFHLYLG